MCKTQQIPNKDHAFSKTAQCGDTQVDWGELIRKFRGETRLKSPISVLSHPSPLLFESPSRRRPPSPSVPLLWAALLTAPLQVWSPSVVVTASCSIITHSIAFFIDLHKTASVDSPLHQMIKHCDLPHVGKSTKIDIVSKGRANTWCHCTLWFSKIERLQCSFSQKDGASRRKSQMDRQGGKPQHFPRTKNGRWE